jgi:hypothetical protein
MTDQMKDDAMTSEAPPTAATDPADSPVTQEPGGQFRKCPGLDAVGRGIYLRPRQPYQLRRRLFRSDRLREFDSIETGQKYQLPDSYEVNDSPPMPAQQAINQMKVEESWDRVDEEMSLDTGVAAGNALFSIDASSIQAKQLRTEEDAFYALRTSFIPFFTIYVPDATKFPDTEFDVDVPIPFNHDHRREYEAFFDKFGTHYVRRVWVGGKATQAITVLKSSRMSKEEIQEGLRASFSTMAKGNVEQKLQSSRDKLQTNATCTVWGKGGDRLKLAALSSLDQTKYDEWLGSVPGNPGVIELEVVGIWTLIKDPKKAQALQDAYAAASTFTTLSAVFGLGRQVFFLRGDTFCVYDIDEAKTHKPVKIKDTWTEVVKIGFDRIDAAFNPGPGVTMKGEDISRKFYVFRGDKYLRVDYDTLKIDEGYPRPISEGWPNVPFRQLDAVLVTAPDSVYFFCGGEYVRFNMLTNQADDGYPQLVKDRWPGLTFDRIDAAFYRGNGKAYFFKDDQHIRFDMVNCRVDPGYPKYILGSYVEDWTFLD